MKTVYLAWQNQGKTRQWYPIGRLDADTPKGPFQFRYTQGATRASEEAGLQPLTSFPEFERLYESKELFPLFKNRILSTDRDDFVSYLEYLDLRPDQADPLEILAISEGRRQTDTLEVFPKLTRNNDGSFYCRFFLHGWRHVSQSAQERIPALTPSENLRVAVEMNNPATRLAIQLQTSDYHMIGWTPRYLVEEFMDAINESFLEIRAKVIKVNPATAATQQRVLIEMSGKWPETIEPMSSSDFQPLAA